ncbi:hypothetical protein ACLPJK_25985 [Pseudomonas aeruginosa]|uniref:hypothetical protein n=1 Tax=Pseudomonas aeruginosa TaxID=287 RepID=UPI003D28893F
MRSSDYTRNAARVNKAKRRQDGAEYALEPLTIHIPSRFTSQGLATFENETTFMGLAAWITQDRSYAVSRVTSFIRTEPSRVNTIVVDDVEYIEMSYEPGDVLVANTSLPRYDSILYNVFDEFQAKGKAPWYFNYEDYAKLYQKSSYYNGVNLNANPALLELLCASICRNAENPKQYFRHVLEKQSDVLNKPSVIVPLRENAYGPTNTVARLLGPYLDDNITGALVNETTRLERIDKLLRM